MAIIERVKTTTNPPEPKPEPKKQPTTQVDDPQKKGKITGQGGKSPKSGKPTRKTKPKTKRTPPVHTDEEIRSLLYAIKAETQLSFKQILKAALRALHDKLAYLKPISLKRLCSESLRTLAGILAQIEKSANGILRQIILAKIDPVKKAELADKLDCEIIELQTLRRTISREAGIPLTQCLTTDAKLAIIALEEKKQETAEKSDQISYSNIIELLKRYQLDTYEPDEELEDDDNLNP